MLSLSLFEIFHLQSLSETDKEKPISPYYSKISIAYALLFSSLNLVLLFALTPLVKS